MFNFLSDNDSKYNLLTQQDFSGSYQLTTKSCLVMGKDNPPIHVSSKAWVDLKQTVEKNKIWTKVHFIDTTCETDSNNLKESLQEMQLFQQINPVIAFRRDANGKVKNIGNMPEIWQDWENWKEKRLSAAVADERKRQKIIKNYEDGLKSLEYNFEKNLQYILLLPECYQFKNYPNPQDSSSTKTCSSRFIEKLDIFYRLQKKSFSVKDNIVSLILDSQSNIKEERIREQLVTFYENQMPGFSIKDYLFNINAAYSLDKTTSKIIDAKLFFIEKLHPNFTYTIELELIRENNDNDKLAKQLDEKAINREVTQAESHPKSKWTIWFEDDDIIEI